MSTLINLIEMLKRYINSLIFISLLSLGCSEQNEYQPLIIIGEETSSPPPEISLSSNIDEGLTSTQFTFLTTTKYTTNPTLLWYVDEVEIENSEDTLIKNFSSLGEHTVKVFLLESNISDEVTVTVKSSFGDSSPSTTLRANSKSGVVGDTIIFTATTDKFDTTFNWYIDGEKVSNSTSTLSQTFAKVGSYKIEMSATANGLTSDNKSIVVDIVDIVEESNSTAVVEEPSQDIVEVEEEKLQISLTSNLQSGDEKTTFIFYVDSNLEDVSYSWYIDGEPLSNETAQTLSKLFSQSGEYEIKSRVTFEDQEIEESLKIAIYSSEFNCSTFDTRNYLSLSDVLNDAKATSSLIASVNSRVVAKSEIYEKVTLFYPKLSSYERDFSDKSIYYKDESDTTLAVIQFSTTLQNREYYIKYYDYDGIAYCENSTFPEAVISEDVDLGVDITTEMPSIF